MLLITQDTGIDPPKTEYRGRKAFRSMEMDIRGKEVLIVGLGATGRSLARFCAGRGARVTVSDAASPDRLKEALFEMAALPVTIETGGTRPETVDRAQMVLLSPGVPHDTRDFRRARERGVPVLGEIELAYRYLDAPIAAVTGTNGKTTTATLTARMLEASGREVFLGGNIGTPLIECVLENRRPDVAVVEVSSFQLDTVEKFRPRAAALLNVTPDHMDRYPDFDAYCASKARIFMNQGKNDTAIVNRADPVAAAIAENVGSRVRFFNHPPLSKLPEPDLKVPLSDDPEEGLLDLSCVRLFGGHNLENAWAAAMLAFASGATVEGIHQAAREFTGLDHRLQFVAAVSAIRFFDDSKATNPDAAARALACFRDRRVVLIAGGRNKDFDFTELGEIAARSARCAVLIGEAADEMKAVFKALPVLRAGSMEEAVNKAFQAASDGDAVLLSPACASFDMYANYRERGDDFKRCVKRLRAMNSERGGQRRG